MAGKRVRAPGIPVTSLEHLSKRTNIPTDDIACWFLDTNYNGESFFARYAYSTGADEPYDKLKRALRAEIDEAAWAALCSTVSRPFPPPETGKIAVKVINHYGDEVLKVCDTGPVD
jgi:adenine-specific DNA-methyltransferase